MRAQHALAWLVEQVVLEGIAEACAEFGGARQAYPLNIANEPKLMPHHWFAVTTKTNVSAHQEATDRRWEVRSCT